MAPTRRHSKESILDGAFNFVREKGYEKISARRIANYINASTAPIYSNFKSMEELEEILEEKAVDMLKESLMDTIDNGIKHFLDVPLKYIEFAFDERNLFNQISKSKKSINTVKERLKEDVYVKLIKHMKELDFTDGLTDKQLQEIMINTWLQSHGIATFLDRDKSKEENLAQAKELLENLSYASVYAVKNNFKVDGI